MDGNHSTNDEQLDRRTFLRRGTAASIVTFGGGLQDDGSSEGEPGEGESDGGAPGGEPVPRVRIVLPQLGILQNKFLHRLVVLTGNVDERGPGALARQCLSDPVPDSLDRHDAIVADWEGVGRLTAETAQEATEHVVPTHAYLRPDAEVNVGAPYVIVGGRSCGDHVSVVAHKLPEAVRGGVG